jgi:hypothetical protein
MKTYSILTICMTLLASHLAAQEKPDGKPIVDIYMFAKITVFVHDELGHSVPDAKLHIKFSHANGAYNDGYNDFHVKSNAAGEFTAESECMGAIFIEASKEGYYPSQKSYQPADWSQKHENGEKLQPWNPTIPITLKKIGKGAPMYARAAPRKTVDLPSQDEVHGYDMIEDDWVVPHGKGQVADLWLRAHMDVIDDENFDSNMVITFPNRGDGWIALNELQGIESEMKYPREAPVAGYRDDPIKLKFRWRKPHDKQLPEGGNPYGYILRLRTKLNENGEVLSAVYAKIIDSNLYPPIDPRRLENPIYFGSSPKLIKENKLASGCFFQMHYYLNPKPNDRTLEFDRKTNHATESERPASDLDP